MREKVDIMKMTMIVCSFWRSKLMIGSNSLVRRKVIVLSVKGGRYLMNSRLSMDAFAVHQSYRRPGKSGEKALLRAFFGDHKRDNNDKTTVWQNSEAAKLCRDSKSFSRKRFIFWTVSMINLKFNKTETNQMGILRCKRTRTLWNVEDHGIL